MKTSGGLRHSSLTLRVRSVSRSEIGTLESRFHLRHESEASLLGVVYDDRGIMTAAPYRVIDATHWVFEGTGLREGNLFGHARCTSAFPAALRATRPTRSASHRRPARACSPKARTPTAAGPTWSSTSRPAAARLLRRLDQLGQLALVDDAVSQITRNVMLRFRRMTNEA